MNITFLIGNGFDVGLGMKSRFKDFFPIYKEKSQNKESRIKQLSDSIESNYDTWADFEKALGEYTLKFTSENKQDFIDQVKDFETEFIAYLKWQESTLSFKDSDKIAHIMIEALTKFYSSDNLAIDSSSALAKIYNKSSAESHFYNFVNFNYTSLLLKALQTIPQNIICKRKHNENAEKADKIGKIIHVHGYCDKLPIIGVNDASQIANKELAKDSRFARYIIKPSISQYLRQGYDRDTTSIINSSTIICVYGMSLGATDKKWWDLLMQWLSGSSDRQLVMFEYDDKYSPTTPYGWLEKEDSIMDKLTGYNSNKGLTVENLRSRIHIAVHKNIFQMNLQQKKDDEYSTLIEKANAMQDKVNYDIKHRDEITYITEHSEEIATAQKIAEKIALLTK